MISTFKFYFQLFQSHLKNNPVEYDAVQSTFNASFIALKLLWRFTHICRRTYATTITLMTTKDLSVAQASLGPY